MRVHIPPKFRGGVAKFSVGFCLLRACGQLVDKVNDGSLLFAGDSYMYTAPANGQ